MRRLHPRLVSSQLRELYRSPYPRDHPQHRIERVEHPRVIRVPDRFVMRAPVAEEPNVGEHAVQGAAAHLTSMREHAVQVGLPELPELLVIVEVPVVRSAVVEEANPESKREFCHQIIFAGIIQPFASESVECFTDLAFLTDEKMLAKRQHS